MARAKRKPRPARRIIDGVAMRAVLKSYQHGEISAQAVRMRLAEIGVAGKAADAMAQAFRPRTPEAAP